MEMTPAFVSPPTEAMHSILVVDDDRETCRFITELIGGADRRIVSEQDPVRAMHLLRSDSFDLMISDINLNAASSGLDLLRAFKSAHPAAHVLLISGFGTLETAIEAVRAGAFDYISKPFNIAEIKAMVERALAHAGAQAATPPPSGRTMVEHPPGLIGRTSGMLAVYKQIAFAADSTAPVLILGESGTGKELVARAVHANGRRVSRPFVALNCGAVPETLLESELFGHARGAFTGAIGDRKGIFEQASGGTVFLDEIGETSLALQVRLLRAIEEGEVRPVGGNRAMQVDARVISATNRNLADEVTEGRFRQDLFYRLSVIVISVPPLRERRADIPLLVERFLQSASARAGRTVDVSSPTLDALVGYDWPGNVRELENTIERAVLFSRGSAIDIADLPDAISRSSVSADLHERVFADLPSLDELERRYLVHVLQAVGGNRTRAAEVMGIDRRTLYRMAARFGLDLGEES
jgi:DNA-binding NtrC family response regulator